MVSHLQTCQRAFVRALLAVAAVLRVEAGVSRDSQPDALRHASGKVFRKASKSPHPEGLQDLRAAKAAWEEALLHTGSRGRPASKDVNTSYRLQSEAVLLTYQSFQDFDQWRRFLVFIQGRLSTWRVKHWCATLELCKTERFTLMRCCNSTGSKIVPPGLSSLRASRQTPVATTLCDRPAKSTTKLR